MDQNYTNAIFSTKNLRYPGKPGLTQAILPHSTQKKQQRVCQRMQGAQNTNIPAKTFAFWCLVTKCSVWGRLPVSPSNSKDSFWCKILKNKTPFTKTHSQKPIHKQVGTEQDQRGQYLPRWFYALFCYLCLFLGLDTWIISKPHNQSYKSSI